MPRPPESLIHLPVENEHRTRCISQSDVQMRQFAALHSLDWAFVVSASDLDIVVSGIQVLES